MGWTLSLTQVRVPLSILEEAMDDYSKEGV